MGLPAPRMREESEGREEEGSSRARGIVLLPLSRAGPASILSAVLRDWNETGLFPI